MTTQDTRHTRRLCQALLARLQAAASRPVPTSDAIDRLLAVLPPRQPGESLRAWLDRAGTRRPGPALPFDRYRCTPLSEIRLMAAASGDPLALPEQRVESPDHLFRLTLTRGDAGIEVYIELLGRAIERYAGGWVGIAGADHPQRPLLAARLDDLGEARVTVEDSGELRLVLCVRPVLVLIEEQRG